MRTARKPHRHLLLIVFFCCILGISNGRLVTFAYSLCYNDPATSFQKRLLSSSLDDSDSTLASLSDLLSSPERYAQALNMTADEVKQQKALYKRASESLHESLQNSDLSGKEKHELMCQHRLKFGRHPFSCPTCWSYLPVCVCDLAKNQQSQLDNLQVVVWTHHREWGLTSNTGCILSLAMPCCQLLMKGLPEHDMLLEETILHNEECLPIVLWPDQSKSGSSQIASAKSISLEQVQREISKKKRKIVLIAVDGTWRNARRMVARLPSNVLRLDLPEDVVFSYLSSSSSSSAGDGKDDRSSILSPLRSRGESGDDTGDTNGETRQVCTAEAVVGALMSLGAINLDQGRHILDLTRTKVDRIFRYRGKVS